MRWGSPRSLLVAGGGLAVLLFVAFDLGSEAVVPGWAYCAANAAVLAGILRRCTTRRMAVGVAVLALTFRISAAGMSSLGHDLSAVGPGMTVEQARGLMAGYREEEGDSFGYHPDVYTLIFRDLYPERANRVHGVVELSRGRVVRVYCRRDRPEGEQALYRDP